MGLEKQRKRGLPSEGVPYIGSSLTCGLNSMLNHVGETILGVFIPLQDAAQVLELADMAKQLFPRFKARRNT
jgi:hypothetical protein